MPAPRVVVVAEDDPVIRELLAEVLGAELDVYVVTAADGAEALRVLERVRPALVVTDVMMPGVDGLELARRICDDPRLAGVPVVAISAAVDAEVARAAGCAELLAKPFELDEVVDLVRRHLVPA